MKSCSKCQVEKPQACFNRNKSTKDGLQYVCQECQAAWRDANREHLRAAGRARYEADKEGAAECRKRYYAANRERILAAMKQYHDSTKDVRNAARRAKYAEDAETAEKFKAESRAYREANRQQVRQRQRDSYYANWDKNREWRQANKEYIRVNSANRRAQLRTNGGRFTKKQWREKGEVLGWKCYLCDEQLTPETAVIEHVLPIARGGTNNIDNIMPACAHCNHRKADRTLDEFLNDETYVRGPKKKRKRAA